MRNFNEIFRKDVTKKQGFALYLEDRFFGKSQEEGETGLSQPF